MSNSNETRNVRTGAPLLVKVTTNVGLATSHGDTNLTTKTETVLVDVPIGTINPCIKFFAVWAVRRGRGWAYNNHLCLRVGTKSSITKRINQHVNVESHLTLANNNKNTKLTN